LLSPYIHSHHCIVVRKSAILVVAVFSISTLLAYASAEDVERRQVVAVRTETPPRIDGSLDDSVWQNARPSEGFIQTKPNRGEPMNQQTVIRVLYDEGYFPLISRIIYTFSPDLFIKLFLQWNDDSEVVRGNFLLRYTYLPGSDLYIVYNEQWQDGEVEQRSIVAKLTYFLNL
jgi:hypothetical protein